MAKQVSLILLNKVGASDREALNQRFVAQEALLEIVKAAIVSKLESDVNSRRSINNYSFPAWSEYQADGIGYQRALNEVIELLTFRE
jgi:hypothetical protein